MLIVSNVFFCYSNVCCEDRINDVLPVKFAIFLKPGLTFWQVNTGTWFYTVCIFLLFSIGLVYGRQRKIFRISKRLITLEKDIAWKSLCLDQMQLEKDWLVKEIHHRIKNNLQVVISLLHSQYAYLTHPQALQAIRNSENRMYAISLIHKKLYQAESLSSIDMEVYMKELLLHLRDEYQGKQQIALILETIPLYLDVSVAIPLGLIINEAVTNTLLYAFPTQATGEVKLTLSKDNDGYYLLQIADNGIGLPPGFKERNGGSLGTDLMNGLSRQLHADLEIESSNGVIISLRFKYKHSETYPLSA